MGRLVQLNVEVWVDENAIQRRGEYELLDRLDQIVDRHRVNPPGAVGAVIARLLHRRAVVIKLAQLGDDLVAHRGRISVQFSVDTDEVRWRAGEPALKQ